MSAGKRAVLTLATVLGVHVAAWSLSEQYRYGLGLVFPKTTITWALAALGKHEIEDIPTGAAAVSLVAGVLLAFLAGLVAFFTYSRGRIRGERSGNDV